MNEALIARIQKLLSLATSDNENEAKAASAKANELLVKYNLDMQQIQDAQVEMDEVEFEKSSGFGPEAKELTPLIRDFFMIRAIIVTKRVYDDKKLKFRNMRHINFLGDKTNLQIALYTYQFLSRSYKEQFLKYRKDKERFKGMRHSFYAGLSAGLRVQFESTRKKVETDKALVLIRDPKVDKFFADKYPFTSPMRNKQNSIDGSTYDAGRAVGQSLRIHRGVDSKGGQSGKLLK